MLISTLTHYARVSIRIVYDLHNFHASWQLFLIFNFSTHHEVHNSAKLRFLLQQQILKTDLYSFAAENLCKPIIKILFQIEREVFA